VKRSPYCAAGYGVGALLDDVAKFYQVQLHRHPEAVYANILWLSISVRSFRAESNATLRPYIDKIDGIRLNYWNAKFTKG